jgi:chorismate synthase
MGSNQFGQAFQWTSFGESHGPCMGVVIDGCPAGVTYDEELLVKNLSRRRPGQKTDSGQVIVTGRDESDQPEVLSGLYEGRTLGTPIAVIIRNQDQKSNDYSPVKNTPRRGHADDMWKGKFGHWDFRGGGRASARETVNWVIAGSFAQMFCQSQTPNTKIETEILEIGPLTHPTREPETLESFLLKAKEDGESYGGVVQVRIQKPDPYLGQPIFNKLKAQLVHSFMTINACTGVELGSGFSMARQKGTEVHNQSDVKVYGGIRGGMSTGEDIVLRLAFKPTSSILSLAQKGRHDPCIVLRALPVVEAMAWAVLADQLLLKRLDRA